MNKWVYYTLFWLPVFYPLYDILSELLRRSSYESYFGIGFVVVFPFVLFAILLYISWGVMLITQYNKKRIAFSFLVSGAIQLLRGVNDNTLYIRDRCRMLAAKSVHLLLYEAILFLILCFLVLYLLIGNMVLLYHQQPHFSWMAIEALGIVVAYLHLNFLAIIGYEKPLGISWKRHFSILFTIGLVIPITVFGFIMALFYFYSLSALSPF